MAQDTGSLLFDLYISQQLDNRLNKILRCVYIGMKNFLQRIYLSLCLPENSYLEFQPNPDTSKLISNVKNRRDISVTP